MILVKLIEIHPFRPKNAQFESNSLKFLKKMAKSVYAINEWFLILVHFLTESREIYESYANSENTLDDLSNKPTFTKIHQQIYRHRYLNGPISNEITRKINLLQITMSINLQCVDEFL
jgi:hypothetical protein